MSHACQRLFTHLIASIAVSSISLVRWFLTWMLTFYWFHSSTPASVFDLSSNFSPWLELLSFQLGLPSLWFEMLSPSALSRDFAKTSASTIAWSSKYWSTSFLCLDPTWWLVWAYHQTPPTEACLRMFAGFSLLFLKWGCPELKWLSETWRLASHGWISQELWTLFFECTGFSSYYKA